MKSTLLIVSPQASFGVLVQEGLDPTRFDSFCTAEFSEAILFAKKNDCPTVILDTELEDVSLSVLDIGFALRQAKPDIQIVLITRAGLELDAASLSPAATFIKPVSIPDLSRLLEKLAVPDLNKKPLEPIMPEFKSPERPIDQASNLSWLTDVSRAAQHLTQLTLESAAQAAFITRNNELWAYAGQLSREAAQELTESIQRYWDRVGESDLLRFVRLQATEAQHMLYVRKLSDQMTLALVFDAETPFSTIRSQAGKLVKNLFETPGIEKNQVSDSTEINPPPAHSADTQDLNDYPDVPLISELLGEIPSPNPPDPFSKMSLPWDPSDSEGTPFGEAGNQSDQDRHTVPAMDKNFAQQIPTFDANSLIKKLRTDLPIDLQATRKQEAQFDPETLKETRAQVLSEPASDGTHRIRLESPSISLINLNYACLLIPRLESHFLVGDAATRLNEWVSQLCVAFGWRLEYISVRPDYLQWIARVPLNTAPGYVINMIRKHTSERIFTDFPRFGVENPSGEFWAHGFIVQGGSQPHPQKLIRDFIKTTRLRQGLR